MNRITLFLSILLFSSNCYSQDSELKKEIESVIKGKKATVGVAVIYDGKDTLTVNNQYRYPTMSVYKFYQALSVMNYLDNKNLPLETNIFIKKSDLQPNTYSPLRDEHPDGNFEMSIRDLLKYSVSKSDNNACDILFKYLGGTKVTDKYIKKLGIKETSISATEYEMNKSDENQYLNWTTPLSAAYSLELFLKKDLFSPTYKDYLEQIMIETTTGSDKIKALLPTNTIVGHKTGTSSRNEFGIKIADNDLGFVRLPNNKQYTIAIFVMNSSEDDETNAAIIAKISKAVYDYYITK